MNLAVIFDMDGVLIDSQPLHYEIDMKVLRECGYDATLKTVAQYTGLGNPTRWPKYKEDLGLSQEPDELIRMAEETMREVFEGANWKPIAGIPALLQGIRAMGIKIGIASSSSHELIDLVLTKTELREHFDFIVSGEDVDEGKPSPDVYLKAAEKAGVPANMCIAIEDAPAGIQAAKSAGCICIAYENPNTLGQNFDRADYTVRIFDECFPIIKTHFFRAATGMQL